MTSTEFDAASLTSISSPGVEAKTVFVPDSTTILASSDSTAGGDAVYLPWDNPDNIISFKTYQMITLVSDCVLTPLIFLIGAPTNLISCAVFYRQGLRDRMNLCLFCLALVDFCFLASVIVLAVKSFIGLVDEVLAEEYYYKVLVSFSGVMFAFKAASGCISAVISVERCLCVVFPLKAARLMTTRSMGVLLLVIVLTLQLLYLIIPIRNKVVSVHDESSGLTRWVIVVKKFFVDNPEYFDIIHDVFLSIALPITTFIIVAVATFVTVGRLKAAMKWRASASSDSSDGHTSQTALTKMLVVLSIIYMACSAPLVALAPVRPIVPDFNSFGRYANLFFATHDVSVRVFAATNSAINFYVYYWRSTRFRSDLRGLFRRKSSDARGKKSDVETTMSSIG